MTTHEPAPVHPRQEIVEDIVKHAEMIANDAVMTGVEPGSRICEPQVLAVIKQVGHQAQRHNEASEEPSRSRRRMLTLRALEMAGEKTASPEIFSAAKLYEGMIIRRKHRPATPIATRYPV